MALLASTASLIATPAAMAAQWKWRDASGQIQYSDTPPPHGVKEQDILSKPRGKGTTPISRPAATSPEAAAPPRQAGAAAKGGPSGVEPELERKRQKAEAEKKAQEQADEERQQAENDKACERARGYLRTLEEGGRLARQNARGEREVLDDKARNEEKARAREVMAEACR